MKYYSYLFIVSLFISCQNNQVPVVRHYGALRTIMHKADLSARVRLDTLQHDDLYALGAVENLKGEIIMLNGKSYISSVHDSTLRIDNSDTTGAALLVTARVQRWQEIKIPTEIRDKGIFEKFLIKTALQNNINTNVAFPFRITGTLEYGEWHVIDWPKGDTEHTPSKHKNSGLRGEFKNGKVEILGFYSTKHHGIFTHMSKNMHLHFISENRKVAAHLDNFMLGEAMLLLPNLD